MKLRKILGDIRRADQDYNMIQKGDRIAVGISGGKDSMVLLCALHLYSKFPDKDFSVVGIHIKMGFPDMDFSEVKKFTSSQGIEFHEIDSKIYDILKINLDKDGRIKCSLCSKFKKAAVNQGARLYDCNKVAFGHHSDDAIETLLMNAIYGGKLATFLPKMHLSKCEVEFIRPLIYSYEQDIVTAVENNHIPCVKSTCPNDKHTKREEIKQLLFNFYEKYPMAKNNFQRMLSNEAQIELWHKQQDSTQLKKQYCQPKLLLTQNNQDLIFKGKYYFIVYSPIEYDKQRRNLKISKEDAQIILDGKQTIQEVLNRYLQG